MRKVNVLNSTEQFQTGKIVCVGRNYAEHARELGNEVPEFPIIFLKPSSSMIYSKGEIIHPRFSKELHYELELVLLIGKEIKADNGIDSEAAIAGYGLGLDMTLRDLQNEFRQKGNPWTLAKCFDTSAVVSDFILKKDHSLTLDEEIILKVNGQVKQKSRLNQMIFKPAEIVQYISERMMLEKGDLIFTGTPAGVGKVIPGDILEGEITSIGSLEARVV